MPPSLPQIRTFLRGASINFHFTRSCNYNCHFCFHTEKTKKHAPVADLTRTITLLAAEGVKKINFAGGEPLLFPDTLLELLATSKKHDMYTSVITNGSKLSREWMAAAAPSLDMLGVSFDSASDEINFGQGRAPRGAVLKAPATGFDSRAVRLLLKAAEIAAEARVPLKINTVVTSLNAGEDVSPYINAAAPLRWKVFQVLPLSGENTGEGALKDVTPLLITRPQYDAYVARNLAGLSSPDILKEEPNNVMQSSYVLLDEKSRFLDCSLGSKTPTASVLDAGGVLAAVRELLSSPGGGFDAESFHKRDGAFYQPSQPPQAESEVEVKFAPPPTLVGQLAALCPAPPVVTQFTDTYYDTGDFRLVSADHWLRAREGVLELKSPAHDATSRAAGELRVDFYDENRAWDSIVALLRARDVALPADGAPVAGADAAATAAALARGGLAPFATLTTRRTRYALTIEGHAVHVDVDAVTFGGDGAGASDGTPHYTIGEVELVTPACGIAPREALRTVLTALNVPPTPTAVRGKVLEFIHRYDTARWQALRASGLLEDKLGAGA